MPKRNALNYLIAASLTAPVAAYADTRDVTVYGVANISYDLIDTGATAASQGAKSNRISSNASRLGLKGSEDLGDGLSAVWQVESLVNIGNGGAAGTGIGGRNTYAGLSSAAAGTLLLGRYDTPYNISTRKLDLFGDGIADNRAIMGGNAAGTQNAAGFNSAVASFDGRQDQVVAYISPKLAGMFTGAIAYVNLTPTASLATSAKNSATSLAGMFDIAGGFYGSLAYEVHDFSAATSGVKTREKATKLGLSYNLDSINLNFAYEKTSDNRGALSANLYGHNATVLAGLRPQPEPSHDVVRSIHQDPQRSGCGLRTVRRLIGWRHHQFGGLGRLPVRFRIRHEALVLTRKNRRSDNGNIVPVVA